VATCLAVSAVVGLAFKAIEPDKTALLVKVKPATADPETNVVFLGTSRIERGIIPQVFDEMTRNFGMDGLHSYNAAQGGESILEGISDSEELFRVKKTGIKFVFIEPDLVSRLIIVESNTERAIEFFTLAHAVRAIEFMDFPVRSPPPAIPTIIYLGHIAGASLQHYFNIGWMRVEPEPPNLSISASSRGFPDLDPKMHQSMFTDDRYLEMARVIGTEPPQPGLISDLQFDLILSLASYVQSHGAVPILVRPPQLSHWEFADAVAAKFSQRCQGKGPLFLNFSSAAEYGELYDPRNRMDEDHLNLAGARIFTTLVAQKLATAMRDGSLAKPLCG